jgi:hypothetical protein
VNIERTEEALSLNPDILNGMSFLHDNDDDGVKEKAGRKS